jgi:hypothetical protein
MKTMAMLVAVVGLTVSAVAWAEPAVTCDEGAFAEKVVDRKPMGDVSAIATAHKATYFVVIKNPGAPTTVTLVWKVDGTEVQRQSLDVGTSSGWKTWGSRWIGEAKKVDVSVLDATGATLKDDSLTLP